MSMTNDEFVREAIANARGRLLVLSKDVPWEAVIVNEAPRVHLVVLPEGDRWLIRTVPCQVGKSTPVRQLLPSYWRNLSDQAFLDETGVPDAEYCDRDGLYAVAGSRAGAIELAKQAILGHRF
jgi:uncharacterized UPF0160 family protein